MSDSEIKHIREEVLKNKEFFLLNFINDIPNEEDLIIEDSTLFNIDGILEYREDE